MRKIIFLDIDGVLRPMAKDFIEEYRADTGDQYFDPTCVGVFNAIVRLTGAQIVVHSAWRDFRPSVKVLATWLHSQGVNGHIIGRTPRWPDSGMQEEIDWWLDKHKVDRFLIIDDSDFRPVPERWGERYLKTDSYTGLVRADVARACKVIGTVKQKPFGL